MQPKIVFNLIATFIEKTNEVFFKQFKMIYIVWRSPMQEVEIDFKDVLLH